MVKLVASQNFVVWQVLVACLEEFKFDVPSCELGELNTLADVVSYYSIARNPTTPEERLQCSDLPRNVNLQLEPFRFTEDTKDQFGGKTAFPQRDTVISSLKYKDVYKGYRNPKVYTEKDGFQYF